MVGMKVCLRLSVLWFHTHDGDDYMIQIVLDMYPAARRCNYKFVYEFIHTQVLKHTKILPCSTHSRPYTYTSS